VPLLEVKQDVRDVAVIVSAGGEIDSGTVDTLVTYLEAALEAAGKKLAAERQRIDEINAGVLVSPWLNDALKQAVMAAL